MRGTHLRGPATPGRITLTLDAGLAFGSGEHGSTRGCLRALERIAYRRPRRILDLGTGSGILAMAAARLLHRPVLATDIEPWSVRVAQQNATLNRLGRLVRVRLADGWRHPAVRNGGPYDLVFANILARPLCLMARPLAAHLAPGGTAILVGVAAQLRQGRVVSAHRRCGLALETGIQEGPWTTIILRRRRQAGLGGPPQVTSRSNPCHAARSAANAGSNTRGRSARDRPISASSRSVSIAISCSTACRRRHSANAVMAQFSQWAMPLLGVLTTAAGGSSYE